MNKGIHILLSSNSKRLKQISKQHGAEFRVLDGPRHMDCFKGALGYHCESLDGTYIRNVAVVDCVVIPQPDK